MNAVNQIVRVVTEDESVVQLISRRGEDGRQRTCARFSYYFLMSKTRIRRRRKGNHPRMLCAFGPFRSADQARFISTSAHALGLVETPTSQSTGGVHQAPLPAASARDDDNTENHLERLHFHRFTSSMVQQVLRLGDTSQAA